MQVGQNGGSGKIQSGINVTPLVDVSLVLLIVYMVMTAMIRQGINVETPIARYAVNKSTSNQDKLTTIAIKENHELYLNMKQMESLDELERELVMAYRGHEGQPVIIKGARNLEYGEVKSLMDACRQIGVAEVELMAKKEEKAG
ncbi:MAG: biopolymer transporter ExbD [Candidatus Latescibacterota bacterium]